MNQVDVFTRANRPEAELVAERDVRALWVKYRADMMNSETWQVGAYMRDTQPCPSPDLEVYEPMKYFGSLAVHGDQAAPASGRLRYMDGSSFFVAQGIRDAVTMLHVKSGTPLVNPRHDMVQVARYVETQPKLKGRPYVIGVTYRELANVAIRLGFEPMLMSTVDWVYCQHVRASHMVYDALNPRPDGSRREFKLSMVGMPTAKFVEMFAGSYD